MNIENKFDNSERVDQQILRTSNSNKTDSNRFTSTH